MAGGKLSTIGGLACCVASLGCAAGPTSRPWPWQSPPAAMADSGFSQRLTKAEQNSEKGKLDEARAAFEKLIVDFPDRPEAYRGLGLVADRQRRHREAQSLFSEAIRLRPLDAELFNDLGYSFYLDGQLPKAESALLKAVSLAPSQARYRNNLGLVHGQQGHYEQALQQFRKSGSEADAQYNLAFVYASQEKIGEAKLCFERAVAADPAYDRARQALKSFEQYERDPESVEDPGEFFTNGKVWVPFVEGSSPAAAEPVLAASGAAASRMSTAGANASANPSGLGRGDGAGAETVGFSAPVSP